MRGTDAPLRGLVVRPARQQRRAPRRVVGGRRKDLGNSRRRSILRTSALAAAVVRLRRSPTVGRRPARRVFDDRPGRHGGLLRALHGTAMLHSPVAVIYGERLVADRDRGRRRSRGRRVRGAERERASRSTSRSRRRRGTSSNGMRTASRDVDAATSPAVALTGQHLAVAWATRRTRLTATASRVVRAGRIR